MLVSHFAPNALFMFMILSIGISLRIDIGCSNYSPSQSPVPSPPPLFTCPNGTEYFGIHQDDCLYSFFSETERTTKAFFLSAFIPDDGQVIFRLDTNVFNLSQSDVCNFERRKACIVETDIQITYQRFELRPTSISISGCELILCLSHF